MTKFSDNLPKDIESFFESCSYELKLDNDADFQINDLKCFSIVQLAKAKFFNFSKIMCGFLYSCELNDNPSLYFENTYEDLFEELIQQWLYVLYSKELFAKISASTFIELPFYSEIEDLNKSFKQVLKNSLRFHENFSIIKIYKLWIKNLDKYYENLLTHSIHLLDSNTALDNLRKLND